MDQDKLGQIYSIVQIPLDLNVADRTDSLSNLNTLIAISPGAERMSVLNTLISIMAPPDLGEFSVSYNYTPILDKVLIRDGDHYVVCRLGPLKLARPIESFYLITSLCSQYVIIFRLIRI